MSGANWWVSSFPASVPGGTVSAGGGGGYYAGVPSRSLLDEKRMANGFAPGASYPDGYLGNVTWDRQQGKLDDRSYDRGVHVGSRVPPESYFWNSDMSPDMGLARQAAAVPVDVEGGMVLMTPRFALTGTPPERLAHNGAFSGATDIQRPPWR